MGQTVEYFWSLTPYEFKVMALGFINDKKEENRVRHNDILALAWHTEAFARTERLPNLSSLLIPPEVKKETIHRHKEQTDEEMLNVCRVLNAAFGGVEVEI